MLGETAENVAVIDTGNYYPKEREGRIAAIEDGLPESRWSKQRIRHRVIKAFNGTYAQDIPDKPPPAGHSERIALPVSGDDEAAKHVVRELIDELGFDTVDAGGIDTSRRQQPDTPPSTACGRASKRSPKPWPRCPRSDRRHSGRKRRRGEPADRDGMLHPRRSPPTVARATPVFELGSRHANRLSSFSQPGIWASTSAASGGRRRQR